jgi:hypothetical protein
MKNGFMEKHWLLLVFLLFSNGHSERYLFSTGLGVGVAYNITSLINIEAQLGDYVSASFSGLLGIGFGSQNNNSNATYLVNVGWFRESAYFRPYISAGYGSHASQYYSDPSGRQEKRSFTSPKIGGGMEICFGHSKRIGIELAGYNSLGAKDAPETSIGTDPRQDRIMASLGLRWHFLPY